jgi:hypothetical protein
VRQSLGSNSTDHDPLGSGPAGFSTPPETQSSRSGLHQSKARITPSTSNRWSIVRLSIDGRPLGRWNARVVKLIGNQPEAIRKREVASCSTAERFARDAALRPTGLELSAWEPTRCAQPPPTGHLRQAKPGSRGPLGKDRLKSY